MSPAPWDGATFQLVPVDPEPEPVTEALEPLPPMEPPAPAPDADMGAYIEPGPERDAFHAALAAMAAARVEEVEREQATRKAAHAEADAAFGVELDADEAELRQHGAPAYADGWKARINAYCDEAAATNAAWISQAMQRLGVAA